MALFGKKRGPEVVDFTGMYAAKDREIRSKQIHSQENKKEDIVDFSLKSNSSSSGLSKNTDANDFLSGLASASGSSSFSPSSDPRDLYPSPGPITSSLRRARGDANVNDKVNEMKLKLDDNDYKIGNLTEKIKELELRIREMERR